MSCKTKLLPALMPFGIAMSPLPAFLLYYCLSHTKNKFDKNGFDKEEYDRDGFDRNGYNKDGFDRLGLDADGYDKAGYNSRGINRAGYSKDGQYLLWQKQNKEWFAALKALEKFRYKKAFFKCQEINECILTYICQMEKWKPRYPSQQTCVKAMIDACLAAGIFSDDLAKDLDQARNQFAFPKNIMEKEDAAVLAFKSTVSLMNLWEKQYIKPYHTYLYE